jgi:hypothetical protein
MEAQSNSVAKSLSLNDEQSKKLLDAYKVSRESIAKAVQAAMAAGGGAGGGAAFRELMTAERGKLETALKAFLTPEQATQASAILGSFNRGWDQMVNVLDGMGLEEKVKADAMKAVTGFVAESAKAREAAGGDRDAMRAKSQELREKLDGELGKILSADQLAKWKESTVFQRGGGGRRDRGDAPAAGAPAPGAPAPAAGAPATPPAGAKPEEKK